MRKERHLLNGDWPGRLRAHIEKVVAEERIANTEFRALSVHEGWSQIKEKIYQKFCRLNHPTKRPGWLWENFKLEALGVHDLPDRPETYLDKLIDPTETVWFILTETVNEKTKLWFYEGKIKTIQFVIDETVFDELYLVSKKYEWLICINHHDVLIATGESAVERLRRLKLSIESRNAQA